MGSGSSDQIIGYKYYAGIHMVICHGPVDAVLGIEAGEKKVWSGSITSNQTLSINEPNLFGGEKKEGGIQGSLDILFGEIDQTQNAYLKSKIESDVPAYTGVLSLVLKKMYLTAMTQYIKPWSVKVKRLASKSWQTGYADVRGGANPAHMIWEVITHKGWGMGLATAKIDDASFSAAAAKLYNEGFGLSMLLTGQTPCEDFILNILKHISAVLYNDRITGQYKLKLIRDDYDLATVPSFDEDNIATFNSFERPQFAEMVNEVIIVYQPQGTGEKQSVSIQDLASITAQGGVISQTINYIGIDNQDIAAKVAQRDLRQYSTPLAQIRITVNRDGWKIEPGAVFKLSWAAHGIKDMACRATSINLGDYRGHQIIIDAVEDIFSLPTSSYLVDQIPQWIDPVSDPVAAPSQAIKELPYWNIQRQFNPAALSEVDSLSGYAQLLVENPPVPSPGYLLVSKPSSASTYTEQHESEYTPKAKLLAAINYTQGSISLKDVSGDLEDVVIGTYAYIENEIVRIDSVNLSTLVVTIGRGCLDTVPKPHPVDSVIWFADELSGIDFTEYLQGDSINAKALVRTGQGILPEASAPVSTIAMAGRQNKPYPPGKLRINTVAYPSQISGLLSIAWAHRDRTLQLAKPIPSEDYGNIGPETGVTYSLKLYDEKNVLRVNQTGLTVTNYTWTTEEADSLLSGRLNEYVRLELWSVRAGIGSAQTLDFSIYRPQIPHNISTPLLSGTAGVGETLFCSTGTWEFSPTSYAYQWERNFIPIGSAEADNYGVVPDDVSKTLRCKVTATNSVGSSFIYSSNSIYIPGVDELWSPLDIMTATLAAWYQSSDTTTINLVDGKVSEWVDKSGNSRNLLQGVDAARPTYVNGAVVSNGSSTLMNAAVNGIADGTRNSYILAAVTTPNENQGSIYGQGNTGTSFYNSRNDLNILTQYSGNTDTTSSPVCPILAISGNAISLTETRNSLAPFLISRSVSIGVGNKASVFVKREPSVSLKSSLNFESFVSSGYASSVVNLSWTGIWLPGTCGASANIFNGSIHEFLWILGIPSDLEMLKIEGYLAWTNGLETKLSATHPYKSAPPKKSVAWTPGELDTALWFDASDPAKVSMSGSNIVSLLDKSGNNRNTIFSGLNQFTRVDNEVNGRSVARCPANRAAHRFSTFPTNTIIVVFKWYDTPASWEHIFEDSDKYHGYDGTVITDPVFGNVGSKYGYDATMYLNGNPTASTGASLRKSTTAQIAVLEMNTIGNYFLGLGADQSSLPTRSPHCDYCEVIATESRLSAEDRQKLEGYLAWKWGLRGTLPASHPYKNNPPIVLASTYSETMVSLTPLYYWRLGEVSGAVLSPTVGALSLTLTAPYTLGVSGMVVGDANKAIEFTSTTGYGLTPLDAGLSLGTGDFTMSMILKFTTTTFSTVLDLRAGTGLTDMICIITTSRIAAGDISAETWDWQNTASRVRSSAKNDGLPHSVIVRYTHATRMLDLWIDCTMVDSRVQATGRTTGSMKVCLGNNTNYAQGFIGVADEVALFDRALSNSEIMDLHAKAIGQDI